MSSTTRPRSTGVVPSGFRSFHGWADGVLEGLAELAELEELVVSMTTIVAYLPHTRLQLVELPGVRGLAPGGGQ